MKTQFFKRAQILLVPFFVLFITTQAVFSQEYTITGTASLGFNIGSLYELRYNGNYAYNVDYNSITWTLDSPSDGVLVPNISYGSDGTYPTVNVKWSSAGVKSLYMNGVDSNGNDIYADFLVVVDSLPIPQLTYERAPAFCSLPKGKFMINNYNESYDYKAILPNGDIATEVVINGSVFYAPEGVYTIRVGYNTELSYSEEIEIINPFPSPGTPVIEAITQPVGLNLGSIVLSGLPSSNWTIQPGNIKGSGASFTITDIKKSTSYYVENEAGCRSLSTEIVIINTINNENYIHTIAPLVATTNENTLTSEQKIESVTYYDGLGRPKQSIAHRAGANAEDIITHIGYDNFGRQAKDFLPFAQSNNQGVFIENGESKTLEYYNTSDRFSEDFSGMDIADINPYSEKNFEKSPLNRILEQAAPGTDWALDKESDLDHTIKFDYNTNSVSDAVRLYEVDLSNSLVKITTATNVSDSFYANGELYKTSTKDENWTSGKNHTTEEFKNKQGQVILKRTYADINGVSTAHDTYYIYDDYGNLTFVLPPKVSTSDGVSDTEISELCYQYKYDNRNRLVEKKIPGKDLEYIVYDKLDRPVLTQDANLRANNQWLFTKYDVFGRVVYTGIYTHFQLQTQAEMQSVLELFYEEDGNNPIPNLYESKLDVENSNHYYSNQSFPDTNTEILTINYYDNYDFDLETPLELVLPTTVWETGDVTTKTKSLATGSKIKVLGESKWITTLTAYDEKARPIWTGSHNEYLNTTDIVKSKLDFVGKVDKTVSIHSKETEDDIVVIDKFTYDHAGRLLSQVQHLGNTEEDVEASFDLETSDASDTSYTSSGTITLKPGFTALPGFSAKIIANQTEELIVANTYDELGQLESKKVGGAVAANSVASAGLQKIDYSYNIRGWLKNINNDIDTADDDLFNFSLKYNDPTTGTALFNGNISQTSWNTQSVNDGLNPLSTTYNYSYDALNRITAGVDNTGNYNLNAVSYDKNGNILNLSRQGHTDTNAAAFGLMDDLVYSYDLGNKLFSVTDISTKETGFKDGNLSDTDYVTEADNDYKYDANGNMVFDKNKGITAIEYNHLNLPTEVQFGTTNKIQYIYDATGVKLQKKVIESGKSDIFTKYAGNYIYKKEGTSADNLEFFSQPEGYIKLKNAEDASQGFDYVYQYKDHLGNVRLSYTDNNGSLEIVEENNYYPFGLKHKGYNNITNSLGNSTAQKFGYNGNEHNEELGLGWIDFGARNYDSSLGRWMNLDPLSEKYTNLSPFTYVANNPVNAIDPDGRLIIFINGYRFGLGNYDQKEYRGQEHIGKRGIYDKDVFNYWSTEQGKTNSFGESVNLVNTFSNIHDDYNTVFASGASFPASQASDRAREGRAKAKKFHEMVQNGDVKMKKGETIKIVSHSHGGAHSVGFANQLTSYVDGNGDPLYKIEVIYYITPHQPTDITNPEGVDGLQISHPNDAISSKSHPGLPNGGSSFGRIKGITYFHGNDIMGGKGQPPAEGALGNRGGHNATDNRQAVLKLIEDFCSKNPGKCSVN